MHDANLGVMIARGDLAVEIGFERLSEIQQEILWICEAAHVPVIWATQVLETMNKTGFATRSEISDASMGIMAECVMLNKGPFVVKTVETLADILKRLSGHMDKKRYINRPLAIARSFLRG
jgi:pyruvate kinase